MANNASSRAMAACLYIGLLAALVAAAGTSLAKFCCYPVNGKFYLSVTQKNN